jgi:hypothetical protein
VVGKASNKPHKLEKTVSITVPATKISYSNIFSTLKHLGIERPKKKYDLYGIGVVW